MTSLRDLILQCVDKQSKSLEVPEWGATVFIRSWTGAERGKILATFDALRTNPGDIFTAHAKVLVVSLVDQNGNQLFNDKDVPMLLEKRGDVIDRIASECLRFNGIGAEADLRKN